MMTTKNLIFDFLNKGDVRRCMTFLYNALKDKKIYSREYPTENNSEFKEITFSTVEDNKILINLKYKKPTTNKKAINTRVVADIYEFLKEFFVYLYLNVEPENVNDGESLQIKFDLDVNCKNFNLEQIKNNIDFVCEHELNNLKRK